MQTRLSQILLATRYSLLATAAFAAFTANAAAPEPRPDPRLQAAWTLFLTAQTEADYQKTMDAALAIKSPDARMLIGAFRDVDIAKKLYSAADKKHSALLGAPTKAEQKKRFNPNPFDTPGAYDRFDTNDPLIGRYQDSGKTLTLDITAYPYDHYLATLTHNGKTTRLVGLTANPAQLTLASVDKKITATRNAANYTLALPGQAAVTLARVTVGKTNYAPPPGAAILLDAKTGTKNFRHGKNGERPLQWLSLPGGIMQITTGGSAFSVFKHNDARIYLEYRHGYNRWSTDLRRGNSGLYVYNSYEIQIIDSFTRPATETSEGAIYHIAVPKIQASAPPLEWQSIEVDFTAPRFDATGKKIKNARMTVWHNTVKIHDDVELPNPTAGSVEGGRALKDPVGPQSIMLQAHGGGLQYRNIWILPKN